MCVVLLFVCLFLFLVTLYIFGYIFTSSSIHINKKAAITHTLCSVCSQDNWDDDEEDEEKKTDVKKPGLYSSTACLSLMDYT